MWTTIRSGISAMAPRAFVDFVRRRRIAAIRRRNSGRSAREIFREIYLENKWGGSGGAFNSGSGSTEEHAQRYTEIVKRFIREHGVRRVVDLGCGDFTVGAQLVEAQIDYVGVDIVEELVRHNEKLHGGPRVRFECLDIIEDALPDGDLCLVRQVLQHLANDQIRRVLRKLTRYRYVLVTEHFPAPGHESAPNRDKACGEDVRVYDGSAVYLDEPPFDVAVTGPILDVDAGHWLVRRGERIRTFLIDNAPSDKPVMTMRRPGA
jgi:SAM-dependent methyltransferase